MKSTKWHYPVCTWSQGEPLVPYAYEWLLDYAWLVDFRFCASLFIVWRCRLSVCRSVNGVRNNLNNTFQNKLFFWHEVFFYTYPDTIETKHRIRAGF